MTANCTDLNEDLTAKDTPGNDVETGSSWNYIYNDWLAVDMGSLLSTTATIEATSEDQMRVKLKYKFMIQFSREIRNGHLWISIFSKSPASQFTRVQRLTCALSLLLSTMLTNLMFYGIPTDEPADQSCHTLVVVVLLTMIFKKDVEFEDVGADMELEI
ncbi:PK1L2-like protein [Mya arenaria]|uniref:PK1L2-like protein n=1 Tax=Mya arenaria TaxID=6604 RepID=A0ABY7DC55_MYAAR|nr:PK1L2-like protein [Mya arenaria]